MFYPQQEQPARSKIYVQNWKGLNRNLRTSDGEFAQMENMTGDRYPVLSPRKKRNFVCNKSNLRGIAVKTGKLVYVDGGNIYYDDQQTSLTLEYANNWTDEEKQVQIVSMGAYLIFFPRKDTASAKYLNTADLDDYGPLSKGPIGVRTATSGDITYEICDQEGNVYTGATVSGTSPASPENGSLWLDTSGENLALKKYDAGITLWVTIPQTYVKISANNIGGTADGTELYFSAGDTVKLELDDAPLGKNDIINEYNTIEKIEQGYIVVTGILEQKVTQTSGLITYGNVVPKMDFVVEAGNRLWGCRYGMDGDKMINEIYACALGDFRNWNKFQGLSTDSYTASRGSDGPWTGAITYAGRPTFFKENCIETVYPSTTGAHQITVTNCRGCQASSPGNSLAIVNEILYYYTGREVVAYDGSYPVSVSDALGSDMFDASCAGALGNKYYICRKNSNYPTSGRPTEILCYDTKTGLWHREDESDAIQFAGDMHSLYFRNTDGQIWQVEAGDGASESDLYWMVETGDIGLTTPNNKYISRLNIRLALEKGAWVDIYVMYDSNKQLEFQAHLQDGNYLRSTVIPIRPRRCDHMRIHIKGYGDCKIYSIAKQYEEGSDIR